MSRTITREELQARLASSRPPVLLEALPAKYFLEGHLPGARHFPHDRARALAPTIVPDKERAAVTYCASDTCPNSHIAARALEALGYKDVSVYAGGKKDWIEAGYPVEVGGAVEEAA